ncbi:HlyD family type I secretion periplasmic adaptor subunit [Vibrio tetraodonis]|uniref:HlyD family type I secretion periplasmic adaptor subunit n=1 Tax=Vibrio tetraodonis TaxID=2231647 RepID=UPI000E09FFF5|nr:HlyD family type I secretion periplasmic adaptor subunit [Vibrio tetraodonis]
MINIIKMALKAQKRELQSPKRPQHEYEFLPAYLEVIEKPPSPWSRRVAFTIATFLLVTLVWSIVGQLDIHASAQGKVMVSSHSKVIQALEQGEVIAINVRNGQHVRKGDILIQLNPAGADAESSRLAEQKIRYQLDKSRLEALLSDAPLERFNPTPDANSELIVISRQHLQSEYTETTQLLEKIEAEQNVNRAELKANRQAIAALNKLKQNITTRLNARQALMETNSIARVELLEQERELLDVERDLSNLQSQTEVLSAQAASLVEQRETLIAQKRLEYFDELNQVDGRIAELEQELVKARERQRIQALRSPVDGVVQQLSIHTLGGVASPAEPLMVIVPKAADLEAEVNVLNKDIGFVMAGQAVEIKIDSFPFTKYGTISGELLHVSKDAVEDEQLGYVFPARIRLNSNQILVDDKWVTLGAGMSLSAEIKTGTRRIIDYLLSPLQQYQSEAMRER